MRGQQGLHTHRPRRRPHSRRRGRQMMQPCPRGWMKTCGALVWRSRVRCKRRRQYENVYVGLRKEERWWWTDHVVAIPPMGVHSSFINQPANWSPALLTSWASILYSHLLFLSSRTAVKEGLSFNLLFMFKHLFHLMNRCATKVRLSTCSCFERIH